MVCLPQGGGGTKCLTKSVSKRVPSGGAGRVFDADRQSVPERDSGKPGGRRAVCPGSLSERDMGSVAAAAADCNGALRYGAGIFHRSSILPANTAAAPRNPLGGSGGGHDLHRHGGGAAPFYRQPCRLDEHPRSAARTGGNDGADSGAVCSPYARHAKFTWGIKNGGALAGLLPGFRLVEEHSLTEDMAEFVPIYKLLGKLPFVRNISNKIIVLEK